MKVIKRDGRVVDYNREKIEIAIEKANDEVRPKERATKQDIKEISKYIEQTDRKRMLVEEIQDIIEEQLMDMKKFELAKKYMIYRYTRALVRKANTTDESILGLITNKNKDVTDEGANKKAILAPTQRNYIAGEVSKDLTKRILLPERITKAHEEGVLCFHDMDYFLQPIFNSSLVNIGDMLDNGTVINGNMIETPKSFQVACDVMSRIMAIVASNQYGEQSVDISHLGKYVIRSYEKFKRELVEEFDNTFSNDIIEKLARKRLEKEIKAGVQTIQYQLNTLITTNGQCPSTTIFLNLKQDDPYIKENALIIEEFLKQRYQGIKDEKGIFTVPKYPKLVYVLDEHNCLKGGEYDYLTKLAIKCSEKCIYPSYISAKKMRENYEGNVFSPMGTRNFLIPWKDENGNYKFEGRFNQGVVSINLPQIAIVADGDEEKFWELLTDRLELCREALMCRHYALLGTDVDSAPINWKYGAISRLKSGDKIDELLKNGYSTLSLGYVGIYEMTKIMKKSSHTSPEGHDFAIKVMKKMKETCDRWRKETGLGFVLYATPTGRVCHRFVRIDNEVFGEITGITDKEKYTNSYHVPENEEIDVYEKMKLESEFQKISLGGCLTYIDLPKSENRLNELEEIIKFIYDNIEYVEFRSTNND